MILKSVYPLPILMLNQLYVFTENDLKYTYTHTAST